ncbi:uncharacterized protein LOC129757112 isoform X1 [Uranotaenia lowii]|uniref:uncharacterized protein LOC129757112 isoform X1 n=1 Tax=Uranotaenia lowii TaxID=190385 RepID=UPI00247AB88A|nr:uncharacterized protein LOC129757112 isoform X1 [Uranotaenia lowii]
MALRFNCSELIIPPSEAHCHQKPLVDYDEKSREMVKFISDVEYFVDHFEATIRQRNVYRRRFDFQLMDIEENLRKLIVKADQAIRIPAPRTDYQLKACCNIFFQNYRELKTHYYRYHSATSNYRPVMQSGPGKLEYFRQRLEEYLTTGTRYSNELLLLLKKVLMQVRLIMLKDTPVKVEDRKAVRIYHWKDFKPEIILC